MCLHLLILYSVIVSSNGQVAAAAGYTLDDTSESILCEGGYKSLCVCMHVHEVCTWHGRERVDKVEQRVWEREEDDERM